MEFKRCAIAGVTYGEGGTEAERGQKMRLGQTSGTSEEDKEEEEEEPEPGRGKRKTATASRRPSRGRSNAGEKEQHRRRAAALRARHRRHTELLHRRELHCLVLHLLKGPCDA